MKRNHIILERNIASFAAVVTLDRVPLDIKPSLKIRPHSPTGFNWGYGGSGPAQLALAILLKVVGRDLAEKWYQHFKTEHVARWHTNKNWMIEMDIADWVREKESLEEVDT